MTSGAASPPADSLSATSFGAATASLCRAAKVSPEGATLSLLYQGELADSSQVFLVRAADERPLGIVQLSAAASPGMVARGVARARIAASALEPALSRAVLLPIQEGEIDGRSYAVMPYCLRFSHVRWRWAIERMRLRPLLLRWLLGVTRTTLSAVPPDDLGIRFRRPLERLAAVEGASPRIVEGVARALSRLASGAWQPRFVLMHGDVWKGNTLLRPLPAGAAPWSTGWSARLAVIDWAGAQLRGYAMFDLVRAAESFGVRTDRLRLEVARHCAVLECEPADAPAYVLAAIGALLETIGEFPLDRCLAMAETSLGTITAAVADRRA